MLHAARMGEIIEQEALANSTPNAELYDFGGGWTVCPVPDLSLSTGFLKGFMFAVVDYSVPLSTGPKFKYLLCDISPDMTEEELREKVKQTFDSFKIEKTQETQ